MRKPSAHGYRIIRMSRVITLLIISIFETNALNPILSTAWINDGSHSSCCSYNFSRACLQLPLQSTLMLHTPTGLACRPSLASVEVWKCPLRQVPYGRWMPARRGSGSRPMGTGHWALSTRYNIPPWKEQRGKSRQLRVSIISVNPRNRAEHPRPTSDYHPIRAYYHHSSAQMHTPTSDHLHVRRTTVTIESAP